MDRPPRLVVAMTVPAATRLIRGQLGYFRELGYEVALICSPGEPAESIAAAEGAEMVRIEMARTIAAPHRDLVSLWRIIKTLRRLRPDIVNAGTPKAGLLVSLAAWLTRTPCRVYTVRGLRLETTTGLRRAVLVACERAASRMSHRVICISPSLRDRVLELGLTTPQKATVLLKGSSNGTDCERFRLTDERRAAGVELRERFGIALDAPVIGFVGRVVRDKGIHELAEAWSELREEYPTTHMLLVGLVESEDPVDPKVLQSLQADPRVHFAGEVLDPVPYYAAMTMMAMPSHREGFGNTYLEASAMERPAIGTRIPGVVDAVEDGVSGVLVPVRDAAALATAIRGYLDDPALARRHGLAGRQRVERYFRRELMLGALAYLYSDLMHERGRGEVPVPPAEGRSDEGAPVDD